MLFAALADVAFNALTRHAKRRWSLATPDTCCGNSMAPHRTLQIFTGQGGMMLFIHHGVTIKPSVTKNGHAFIARVSILEEDGEATSLGDLGHFANRESAFAFAVRCGTAFVDDEPMPVPPCNFQGD
jgi:hypothetical protein